MNSELAKVVERVRQNRAAHVPATLDAIHAALASAVPLGAPFLPRTRVFDRVSGLEGEVIGGARENLVVPTAK